MGEFSTGTLSVQLRLSSLSLLRFLLLCHYSVYFPGAVIAPENMISGFSNKKLLVHHSKCFEVQDQKNL
jgi:hypothetical protein